MKPEVFKQLDQLLDLVLEAPPEEHSAILDQACGDNATLRQRVESLIQSDRAADGFLESPHILPPPTREKGDRLGPYRLVSAIGKGGMGEVWLAERDDNGLRVAVKFLRNGFRSTEMLLRFQTEQRILAQLEHSYIARLYDSGTTQKGHPYLVMEYIEGEPFHFYCDRHRLSIRARLKLFLKVCAAVQHAHQNLLIHRDIKPDNILVTADEIPKLLDFGIAKPLRPEDFGADAEATRTGVRLLSPNYASPEQVRGMPVSTASDVYSLGVLLYESLCGRSPYRVQESLVHEVERAVLEQEPERPSTLVKRAPDGTGNGELAETISSNRAMLPRELRSSLRGDLDNIVAKSLHKLPAQRYPTVDQLAADVQRHLHSQPVLARRGTFTYRTVKFIRRNLVSVSVASLFLILIMGFGIMLAVKNARIVQERDRARLTADFLEDLFEVSNPEGAVGKSISARQLLDLGAKRIALELEDKPEAQVSLMNTMGTVYSQMGFHEESVPLLERALAIARGLPGNRDLLVADSLDRLGVVAANRGELGEAEALFSEAQILRQKHLRDKDPAMARSLSNLGNLYWHKGNYKETEAAFRKALDIYLAAYGEEHHLVAESLSNLSGFLDSWGRPDEAEPLILRALEIRRKVLGEKHPKVAQSLSDLAAHFQYQGRFSEAERYFRKALTLRNLYLGEDHNLVLSEKANLARCLEEEGKWSEAETLFREVLETERKIYPKSDSKLATTINNQAALISNMGNLVEAEALYRESLGIRIRHFGEDHLLVAQSKYSLAGVLQRSGQLEEAERLFRSAMVFTEANSALTFQAHAYPRSGLALLILEKGDPQTAEAMMRETMTILATSHPPDHWRIANQNSDLGAALVAQGRFKEAEALFLKALPILRKQRGEHDRRTLKLLRQLSDLYQTLNDPERSNDYRRQLRSAEKKRF